MSSLSTQVLIVCPCVARGAGHVEASPLPMVLSLLELPPELQALFVLRLADVATAGRLARASHTCKELLQARLEVLKEQRRLAAQQAAQARLERKRAMIISCFEPLEEGAIVF